MPHERIGKIIVATTRAQLETLELYQRQALANGVGELPWMTRADIRALEPEVEATAGVYSESTGIIDSHAFMLSLLGDIEAAGAIRALTRLREEGTIRAIGFSGKTPADGKAALAFADVLMCTINAGYSDEKPLVRAAAHQGAGVLVKKPLERGLRHPEGLPAIAAVPGVASILVGTTSAIHLVENANSLRDGANAG